MPFLTRRAALLALAPAAVTYAVAPAGAVEAPRPVTLPGTYALPDGQAKVAATLTATPTARGGTKPGTKVLDVAMTQLGTGRVVTRFATELTKQLHVIAISEDFRTFLHEHGDKPDARGHFQVLMAFPRGGRWHVYADAVPVGLSQQVMRFDLDLDGVAPSTQPAAVPPPTGLEASDGRYAVRFDSLDLRAGQESELRLHVLRDGSPAPDLAPYLGVAAHAVFISVADLTYVHVHAAPAAAPMAGGTGAPMRHDMTGMAGQDMPVMGHAAGGGHGGMPGMGGVGQGSARASEWNANGGGAPLRPGAKVPADLVLHVRAPKAGTYLLWLQFTAGGQVRTVPFVVAVA